MLARALYCHWELVLGNVGEVKHVSAKIGVLCSTICSCSEGSGKNTVPAMAPTKRRSVICMVWESVRIWFPVFLYIIIALVFDYLLPQWGPWWKCSSRNAFMITRWVIYMVWKRARDRFHVFLCVLGLALAQPSGEPMAPITAGGGGVWGRLPRTWGHLLVMSRIPHQTIDFFKCSEPLLPKYQFLSQMLMAFPQWKTA